MCTLNSMESFSFNARNTLKKGVLKTPSAEQTPLAL